MKKKIIYLIIGIVLIISIGICFIIALKNKSNNNVSTSESNVLNNSTIKKGGTYEITGDNSCIVIDTNEDVTLELNDALITCDNGPAINAENAKNVTIKITGNNKINSTTTEELDGAIYAKNDLTLEGTGTLEIISNLDGIVSKDNLVINGGKYVINSTDDGIRGRDSVVINDGDFNITSKGDAIKATNDEDETKGYINILGGTYNINSEKDGIQAETNLTIKDGTITIKTIGDPDADSSKGLKSNVLTTIDGGKITINSTDDSIHSNGNVVINGGELVLSSNDDSVHADGMVEINNGTIDINSSEGIEATYVKINDGTVNISASDDGINASNKSDSYSVKVEINGGNISIKMGQGDTDGIDSNGDLLITGGIINIEGQSAFDYDGVGSYTGGTLIVNGETINSLTNQMMGGMGGPRDNFRPGM